MRRAALLGLSFWSITDYLLPGAFFATILSVSLKARRAIITALAFSFLSAILQVLILGSVDPKYVLRLYLIIASIGSASMSSKPEDVLTLFSRLRLPWRLTLIAFLSQAYVYRLMNISLDARLVVERKYQGFIQKLRGLFVSVLYAIAEDSLALAELIEVYLKNPIPPTRSYRSSLIVFILSAIGRNVFLLGPLVPPP